MVTTKQMNIKSRTCYFYDDFINIKNFDPVLLKLDKKESTDIGIYYIGYVTKKPEYKINSVNPLYLLVVEIDGFIEEKINNGQLGKYGKGYMKLEFDSDDDLPLNKILKFRILIIIIRNIFEKDGKYYPQIFLDDALYVV